MADQTTPNTGTTSNPGTAAVDAKGQFLTALNAYQGKDPNPVNPAQVAPATNDSGMLPTISVPQVAPVNAPKEAQPVSASYDAAKNTYLGMLPALQVKYQNLYNQLEAEKQNALAQNAALSGTEQAQQKTDLAKRGLEVSNDNSYFANERNKLLANETSRDQTTALGYTGKEVDLSGQATTESQGIADKIANLNVEQAKAVQSIVDTTNSMKQAQKFHDDAISQAKDAAKASLKASNQAQKNWTKDFNYRQTVDAANRALDYYKTNIAQTDSAASRAQAQSNADRTYNLNVSKASGNSANKMPTDDKGIKRTIQQLKNNGVGWGDIAAYLSSGQGGAKIDVSKGSTADLYLNKIFQSQ
jgi:hypothetical protein